MIFSVTFWKVRFSGGFGLPDDASIHSGILSTNLLFCILIYFNYFADDDDEEEEESPSRRPRASAPKSMYISIYMLND
jgi:hypothetical protein